MTDGHTVNSDQLRVYASKVADQQDTAAGIAKLVNIADVSQQSWGVVGWFVKEEYSQMLDDLQAMFDSMISGFEAISQTITDAANSYEGNDEAVRRSLEDIRTTIDEAATGR